jgi:hypothetical protein
MNVIEILDTFEEILERSAKLPLTRGKAMVDADHLSELCGDMRRNLPTEIKQAKHIVLDRSQIIEDANREAEQIIAKAQERAAKLVAAEEVYKTARIEAEDIRKTAEREAAELKRAAGDYATRVINSTTESLSKAMAVVKEAGVAIKNRKA